MTKTTKQKQNSISLKTYTVSEESFNYILENFTWKVYKQDLNDLYYGYSAKYCIYYNETDLILSRAHLVALNLLTADPDKDSWYQLHVHKVLEQNVKIDTAIRPIDAIIMINKILKKHYTRDEVLDIYNLHIADSSKPFHASVKCDESTEVITKYTNCVYYDINGAYASELIKMFPKCEAEFIDMYNRRHDNNNRLKNAFNYFIGCLTQNEEKRQEAIEAGRKVRVIYPKTRNYIVNNITDKVLEFHKKVGGLMLYANTDGIIIKNPHNRKQSSNKVGEFKIEGEGDVYTYYGGNYTIFQFTNKNNEQEIKGNLPLQLRYLVDLRVGKVVKYTRVKNSDNYYEYKDVKQEYIYEQKEVK